MMGWAINFLLFAIIVLFIVIKMNSKLHSFVGSILVRTTVGFLYLLLEAGS
jgi:large-conductance mechanosensitive channel